MKIRIFWHQQFFAVYSDVVKNLKTNFVTCFRHILHMRNVWNCRLCDVNRWHSCFFSILSFRLLHFDDDKKIVWMRWHHDDYTFDVWCTRTFKFSSLFCIHEIFFLIWICLSENYWKATAREMICQLHTSLSKRK